MAAVDRNITEAAEQWRGSIAKWFPLRHEMPEGRERFHRQLHAIRFVESLTCDPNTAWRDVEPLWIIMARRDGILPTSPRRGSLMR